VSEQADHPTDKPVPEALEPLARALRTATADACEFTDDIALLFSGGLDSSLAALLACRWRLKAGLALPRLYVAGLKGSHDLAAAASAVELLEGVLGEKLELKVVEVMSVEARKGLEELLEVIGPDPLALGFMLPLYFAAMAANEPLLISGQGADELFGGYARYPQMTHERLAREMESDIRGLMEGGLERDRKVARAAGKELSCPYLDPQVVAAAEAFSAEARRGPSDGGGKALLRVVAEALGLPLELARRPKKAAQYGSGFERIVKAHFKPLHTASLELDYPTREVALAVMEATGLDNPPFVAVSRAGNQLTVRAAARTIGSLEQTLDDFLACADAAARVAGAAGGVAGAVGGEGE